MHLHIVSKRSQPGRLLINIVGAGALITMAPMVHATSGYLSSWQSTYPASLSDNNASCALCHTTVSTSGSLNPYGSAVSANGITGAENLDSDNDPTGSSNIVEINANTQPGWTGTAPSGVTGDLDPTVVVENQPPIADPGGAYSGNVGIDVTFDGTGSTDPDGTIQFWNWDFGDGEMGTGPMPAHAYALEGTYTVTLTVTDNDGASDFASTTASISGGANLLPIADANGPYTGTIDIPVTFDGTGSSDPDGSIISYDWDYGDGFIDYDAGPVPSHAYAATGDYQVTLTVTDDIGDVASDTTSVTIGSGELAPVADANGPYTGTIGTEVTFDGSGSNDPDGTIVTYNWNFGDGTTLDDGGPTPSHAYAAAGTYNVTLTVVDNDGLSDSDSTSASITDPNDVPGDNDDDDDDDDHEHRDRGNHDRDSDRNRRDRYSRRNRD